ncbi:MAG: Methyltransferase type 11 [Firmicutes bacterium]|nr:Methyltransferase type 11 [Bacillota bacterium]
MVARKRIGEKADIRRADLNEPLNFIENKSLDIIVSSLTLHYIKDWNLVMSEFYRVLKAEGILVFSVHHPFMDFTYFNRENYFLTEIIEDEWETNTGRVKVQFYRRPLCKIISPTIEAGFIIEKLIEPMPTEQFKELHPKVYERLTRNPQFIFLRVRK